jgi:NAD(P)-dependent dehydrogenase (short-subunit alcohol dehydrogenase family)
MTRRIAVVTGANRGIGLEIVRLLAEKNISVILAARDRAKGLKAAEDFQKDELTVRYHELDVTSAASISAFGDFLEKEFGRCDILVNNAGIFPDVKDHDLGDPGGGLRAPLENIRRAMETNAYGPLLLCQRLIPLMVKNNYGRIVNMASDLASLTHLDEDGKFLAYRISKAALNMVTRVLAAEIKAQNRNILINSCTPGWCRTDMGGPHAPRDVKQGADTPVWLATLPDNGPTGGFFADRKPIAW